MQKYKILYRWKQYLISSSSDLFTASWTAFTALLFIPRLEQKRLCNILQVNYQNMMCQKTEPDWYLDSTEKQNSDIHGAETLCKGILRFRCLILHSQSRKDKWRTKMMKAWCWNHANHLKWCQLKWWYAYHKITGMNGSHLHWLTHLYFQLLYNEFFGPANLLLCRSICNWAYFCFRKRRQKTIRSNQVCNRLKYPCLYTLFCIVSRFPETKRKLFRWPQCTDVV